MKAKEKLENANWIVRSDVASNPNTPAEALAELAKDENYIVRSNAASHPQYANKTIKRKNI